MKLSPAAYMQCRRPLAYIQYLKRNEMTRALVRRLGVKYARQFSQVNVRTVRTKFWDVHIPKSKIDGIVAAIGKLPHVAKVSYSPPKHNRWGYDFFPSLFITYK